jgi:hypothetical protein
MGGYGTALYLGLARSAPSRSGLSSPTADTRLASSPGVRPARWARSRPRSCGTPGRSVLARRLSWTNQGQARLARLRSSIGRSWPGGDAIRRRGTNTRDAPEVRSRAHAGDRVDHAPPLERALTSRKISARKTDSSHRPEHGRDELAVLAGERHDVPGADGDGAPGSDRTATREQPLPLRGREEIHFVLGALRSPTWLA